MIMISLIFGLLLTLVMYLAYMFVIAFTIWMAIDAGKQDRFWWVLLVIAIPLIGPFTYYFTEKKHEYAKAPSHHIHDSETEGQHEQAPHKHGHGAEHKEVDNS